jgi:hypothetical protein|tara:strand:+ start:26 stop:754 length:729 start_codon:yes stop_codon:yes gene_type:complete
MLELKVGFQHFQINNPEQLLQVLKNLTTYVRTKEFRPLLHLDMHGGKNDGLCASKSGEFLSWQSLYKNLQELNKATKNNLTVVSAACFGLYSITTIKLNQPAPYYVLLAPEEKVYVGFLESSIPKFYQELFKSGSIDSAYNKYLSEQFEYFHCEKLLLKTIAGYVKAGCKGKTAQERREYLLTEVYRQEQEKTAEKLKSTRKRIKDGLKPDQSLLNKYASKFLVNRTCSLNMDQILDELDKS